MFTHKSHYKFLVQINSQLASDPCLGSSDWASAFPSLPQPSPSPAGRLAAGGTERVLSLEQRSCPAPWSCPLCSPPRRWWVPGRGRAHCRKSGWICRPCGCSAQIWCLTSHWRFGHRKADAEIKQLWVIWHSILMIHISYPSSVAFGIQCDKNEEQN